MYFQKHENPKEFLARTKDRGRLGETLFLILRMATVDHVHPLGEGGLDRTDNYEIVCYLCNQKRANKAPHGVKQWEDHE